MTYAQLEELVINTDIDIVTITRVLADGSHVSLGDSSSSIEQLVAALDAMTEGREVVDDIFTHQTIRVNNDEEAFLPKMDVGKRAGQHGAFSSNPFLVF